MTIKIFQGDALPVLKSLPARSVHCCVTSPPYWNLRDYGTGTWEGGDPECKHLVREHGVLHASRSGLDGGTKTQGHQQEGYRDYCPRCGARRVDQQLGLEKTPEEYIAKVVSVFREVKRVLRDDGTLWLNLGDTYTATRSYQVTDRKHTNVSNSMASNIPPSLKPKDMIGIPWRVAFALQADGWYLRQDIIWHKPNSMPESVTDRCTKSHEYIFLLSKSSRYFYDADAIKECCKTGDGESTRNKRSVWTINTVPYKGAHFAVFPPTLPEWCIKAGTSQKGCCPKCGAPWRRQGFNKTISWQPTCICPNNIPIPCTVLDSFGGVGTTGMVAERLGRNSILIELSVEYCDLIRRRINDEWGMFAASKLI